MSGIYIPGMEMPTNCFDCPCVEAEFMECAAKEHLSLPKDEYGAALGEVPNWCPLVHVPEHGDLIDRNKLYEKTADWEAQALHMVEVTMHDEDTTEWRKWSTVLTERSAFKFDVADAPTIIPGEEGEG